MNDDQTIQAALSILESRLGQRGEAINSPETARQFAVLKLAERKQEVFAVFFLNAQTRLIEYRELFFGTIDGASVYPREVVRAVIETNAQSVILAHNHPSQNQTPSDADYRITVRLRDVLEMIDTRLLDHIVVAGTKGISMAELGML